MSSQYNTYSRDIFGLIFCVLFLVIGIAIWWVSLRYSELGAVFPRTIATLLILLSGIYILRVMFKPQAIEYELEGSNIRRFLLFLTMVLWALSLDIFGFLTSSIVGFMAILLIANYDKWSIKKAVVFGLSGLSILIVLFVLFKVVLHVPLPQGMLL